MPKHIGTVSGGDRESSAASHQLLFPFVLITARPASIVTVDVSKISCEQLLTEKPVPAEYTQQQSITHANLFARP
jgi:hypothetical protein